MKQIYTGGTALMVCLPVMRVPAALPENASVIPLTEKDFEQHPALDAVIRGEERNPSAWEWGSRDQRVVGGTNVSYAESKALHDTYGPGGERGLYPLLECEDGYYVVLTTWP